MPWQVEGFAAPISSETLKTLAARGEIHRETLVSRGDGRWVHVSKVKGLTWPTQAPLPKNRPTPKREPIDFSGFFKGLLAIPLVIGFFILLSMGENRTTRKPDKLDYLITGRQLLRDQLRDPDSLQIIKEDIRYVNGQPKYQAEYRAKNGFGGYNVETWESP